MSMHGSLRKAHPQDTTCTYDEEHEYKQYFKEQKNANTGAPWYSQQKIEEEWARGIPEHPRAAQRHVAPPPTKAGMTPLRLDQETAPQVPQMPQSSVHQ